MPSDTWLAACCWPRTGPGNGGPALAQNWLPSAMHLRDLPSTFRRRPYTIRCEPCLTGGWFSKPRLPGSISDPNHMEISRIGRSVEGQVDGTPIDFTLSEGVKSEERRPVYADDVVYTAYQRQSTTSRVASRPITPSYAAPRRSTDFHVASSGRC